MEKYTKNRDYVESLGALETLADNAVNGIIGLLEGRARQNVIFELGFFKAVLGDEYVTVLLKKSMDFQWDFPSDIHGGYYIEYEGSVLEKREEILRNISE